MSRTMLNMLSGAQEAKKIRLTSTSMKLVRFRRCICFRLFRSESATEAAVVVRTPGAGVEDAALLPDLVPLLPFFGKKVRVTLSDGRRIVGVLQVRMQE